MRQRVGLGVAGITVMAGLCWSISSRSAAELVPLEPGTPLTPQLARELIASFQDAGLKTYQQSGGQILVPQTELERYTALLPAHAPTKDWAAEWEHQNKQLTPFSGSRALETNREIARAKLIAGMLRQLPDVEHADIVWDEDEGSGWRQSAKTRATVYLNPKPDRVLTLDVVRAVRLAVAGSKKNLDPDDVVVMDLARQITYDGKLPPTIGTEVLPQLHSLAELYRREICEQVGELNGADVAVRIDLPRFLNHLSKQGDTSLHSGTRVSRLSGIAPSLMRIDVAVPLESHVSATAAENVRRVLQDRIARVTGIGSSDVEQQVSVRFDRSRLTVPTKDQAIALDWPLLSGIRIPHGVGTFGATLAVLALTFLGWRISRARRKAASRPRSTAIPAFRAVVDRSYQPTARGLANIEDLLQLDSQAIQQAYAQLSPKCWATALRGATAQSGDLFAAALAPDLAGGLRKELEQLGPVTIGDIQSAQQSIYETLDKLHAPAV